jgi:carbonic anhydrase
VKAILVLGHEACGAVDVARKLTPMKGIQISSLDSFIAPAVEHATTLDDAIADNARFQAALLGDASPVLRERVAAGTLEIVGGVYKLRSGLVEFLD